MEKKALYIDRLIEALDEQRVLIEGDLSIVLRASGVDEADLESVNADKCFLLLKPGECC